MKSAAMGILKCIATTSVAFIVDFFLMKLLNDYPVVYYLE